MHSVVCISCLVVLAVLGGATGISGQQPDLENQSENKDLRTVILDDDIEMQRGMCGRTKLACRLSGGECQSKMVDCEGDFLEGKQYCRRSSKCGCCVPTPAPTPKGCVFGDTAYPNGDIIEDTCLQLVCVDGDWKYIGQTHRHCGECIVHGEPHIAQYDSTNPENDVKTYQGTGSFAISQPGFKEIPLFGVSSNFESCYNKTDVSCVRTATYHEPGANVTMILPSLSDTYYCNGNDCPVNSSIDPLCMIKVLVNNEERMVDNSVKSFYGTDGNVMVFKHNHINSSDDLNCMNVVGSKGFSVSLCQYKHDYSWFYVWAMPALQNQIYGLCGTYPGIENFIYITRDNTQTHDYNVAAESWKIKEIPSSNVQRTADSNRCDNVTVLQEIEYNCNHIYCPRHNISWHETCVYDACRVANPDNYVEGYGIHALVHKQISVSSPKCNCIFRQSLTGFRPPYYGCVITEAAPNDSACMCTLFDADSSSPWLPVVCFGTVDACKDPSSSDCKTPDTSYESCLQGQGNCGGYLRWP